MAYINTKHWISRGLITIFIAISVKKIVFKEKVTFVTSHPPKWNWKIKMNQKIFSYCKTINNDHSVDLLLSGSLAELFSNHNRSTNNSKVWRSLVFILCVVMVTVRFKAHHNTLIRFFVCHEKAETCIPPLKSVHSQWSAYFE